jgi:type IV pilus assembly protein PilX
MSVNPPPADAHCRPPHLQSGVVLLVALIILVALTLAGVALIRSVDTANIIAGNLAFHQSATNAGERGTEQAVNRLADLGVDALYGNITTPGYVATRVDPPVREDHPGDDWDNFWTTTLSAQAQVAPPLGTPAPAMSNADAACNTVTYVIHRLCKTTGKPNTIDQPLHAAASECLQRRQPEQLAASLPQPPKQVYYRITTRIDGPRGTVSYIQTIVAI